MIYVACPHRYATGGVELLHQLCAELRKYTPAKIWYLKTNAVSPQMPEYDHYGNQYVCAEAMPSKDDAVIWPEIWARMVWYTPGHQVIYWESVDNYTNVYTRRDFPENCIHLAQSEYARDWLSENGIRDIIPVTDYLNEDFLLPHSETPRDNVVLYNPAKGLEFTREIIAAMPDVDFLPLTGLSRNMVIEAMRHSKLYIDFGDHPGKDRMPREAAMCGCCVITGLNGSAAYREDVTIPREYKIERTEGNIPAIIEKIKYVLDTFPIDDFEPYREAIRGEKNRFREGVGKLIKRLEEKK